MERLRKLRKQRNLTMKELGNSLKLAESTISLYESGKREPDLATLKTIADFFDVSIDYLLGKDSQSNETTPISKPNTIVVYGRGQGKTEYEVSEKELKAIKNLLETMKSIPDKDNF